MKNTYLPLLSMVIGWNILSYWTGIHWIGYVALGLGFLGIASEKFAQKPVQYIHTALVFVFSFLQKILLSIVYFLVFTPIALIKKKENKVKENWISPTTKDNSQLEKLW